MGVRIQPRSVLRPQEADPLRSIAYAGPMYLQEVREMRAAGRHYAGFQVAAVAVATDALNRLAVFKAANRNLRPGRNPTKLCAEQSVIHQLRNRGFDRLHALFVSGPPQPDTHSGLRAPTLHPCGECRNFMAEAAEVDEETLIVPVHPNEDVYEIYSAVELEMLHEMPDRAMNRLNVYRDHDFDRWAKRVSNYDLYAAGRIPGLGPELSRSAALHMAVAGRLAVQAG